MNLLILNGYETIETINMGGGQILTSVRMCEEVSCWLKLFFRRKRLEKSSTRLFSRQEYMYEVLC